MRTGTYLISALILNYLMVCSVGPGVRQMSTVIKFYFRVRGRTRLDLRVFDFYKFSTPRLN